jgi:LuxR family maltose regulon positive regulatory protein
VPILQTKLHRPRGTADLVLRRRLHERLDAGLAGPATLVSAPAGYGKSTLVSQWVEQRPEPCAWLSLDGPDGSLRTFLAYLTAAIRTAIPGACAETSEFLRAPDLPPLGVLARCLGNEIDAIETRFILVLDDFQNVSDPAVHELLGGLLRHPPRSLHLVLISRRDPPLPLAKLRAEGRLAEIRLRDLAFSDAETRAILERSANVRVGADALAKLQAALEGWAVGVRLVALCLRGERDPDGFLANLKGGLPFVQDYLIHEVLDAQPPALRDWLLRTSILHRFCAPLCDAVCGSDSQAEPAPLDGAAFVRSVVERGLFAIPLDARGEWYRYHHSFRQVLRARLGRQGAASVAALEARARRWFEGHDLIDEAIEHALAAGDAIGAAEIVERNCDRALDSDHWRRLEGWLERLPEAIRCERPGLLVSGAWIAVSAFRMRELSALLERAKQLGGDARSELAVRFFEGLLSFWNGDGARSVECLEQVLRALPQGDGWIRASAEMYRCVALHISGRGERALREVEAGIDERRLSPGPTSLRLGAAKTFLHLFRGELERARSEARAVGEAARRSPATRTSTSGAPICAGARRSTPSI